ncbi:MAG: hydrogenase small subunit, partial [Myxococcales bacterium]|nr:hydrogenase small subunit [Myxococcales bacterium]
MPSEDLGIREILERRGIGRRGFMGFCATMAGILALPRSAIGQIAEALETSPKPILIWLEFQDCAGNTESFLRASRPTAAEVLLDLLSVDYHETLMAAAGHRAEAAKDAIVRDKAGQYLAIVEGAIPSGEGGAYCTIGGRSALEIARTVCGSAQATIAVGSCAAFGGLPAASPNPTGALSVEQAVPNLGTLVNLPACPVNAENLTAVLVYFLTFGRWPATDQLHRPLFAYGKRIHDACERRAHYDAAQYVENWGDEAHRKGHCLYKMGCKGPVTFQNCPNIRWNEGTQWPIGCGHPCLGCAEPEFWDVMTPFYRHVAGIPGLGATADVDRAGLLATAGVGAAFGAHGLVHL